MNQRARNALAEAMEAAYRANEELNRVTFHRLLTRLEELQRLTAVQAAVATCEAPNCENEIQQPETGRPRMYCGQRCKQAAYRAKRSER